MSPSTLPPGFAVRLPLDALHERAVPTMQKVFLVIAPHIEPAIDDILFAATKLPHIAGIVTEHKDLIKKLEVAHFKVLLGGQLDHVYAESCRNTVEQEAAIGLDGRLRSSAGNFVLRAALDALARKHRFSAAKAVERGKIVSQLIAFDVACAMTLHREAGGTAGGTRAKGGKQGVWAL